MAIEKKVGFLGAGNMAEALVCGLLQSNLIGVGSLLISDVRPERLHFFQQKYSLSCLSDNHALVAQCQILVLAIKPQSMEEVLQEIKGDVRKDQTIISIAAGIPTSLVIGKLETRARVVRAMPNTPALVMEGATAICLSRNATPEDLEIAQSIFSSVGKVVVVDEPLMDAVTGLSGSGPAYVFLAMEALRQAGVGQGLSPEVAHLLVVHTFLGAARMVLETREDPGILRERVSSPGGTTLAGLKVLQEEGFAALLGRAVEAAVQRSKELSRPWE